MQTEKLLFSFEATDENQLPELVKKIKNYLKPNAVLLLQGEMAAGKTTFTRYLCESYSLNMSQSPTYAIHQRYQNAQICIDHFDLYRLEDEDQIETSGIWEMLDEKNNLLLIEWSERLTENWYPLDRVIFKLKITLDASLNRNYNFFELS